MWHRRRCAGVHHARRGHRLPRGRRPTNRRTAGARARHATSGPAPREAPKRPNERTADELAVLQTATNFYHSNLLAEPRALDYLAQRGISVATARQHRLGYAAGDQLLPLLHSERLPLGSG